MQLPMRSAEVFQLQRASVPRTSLVHLEEAPAMTRGLIRPAMARGLIQTPATTPVKGLALPVDRRSRLQEIRAQSNLSLRDLKVSRHITRSTASMSLRVARAIYASFGGIDLPGHNVFRIQRSRPSNKSHGSPAAVWARCHRIFLYHDFPKQRAVQGSYIMWWWWWWWGSG